MRSLVEKLRTFSHSPLATLLLFLCAYATAVLEQPALGVCLMGAVVCLYCIGQDDVLPLILPLLLIYGLSFLCPSDAWLAWLGVPCGVALVYRMVVNLRGIRLGPAFPALVATSLAVLLGGLGSITAEEYFAPNALFIVLGLSFMLVAFYLLLRGSLLRPRSYDVADYVSLVMYVAAAFVSFLLLRVFLLHPDLLEQPDGLVERMEAYMAWRNGASNLVILCLPFIFYYARRHGPWHLLSAVAFYAIGAFSGARAFILCGAVLLAAGFFYCAYGHRRVMITLLVAALLGMVSAVLLREQILYFVEHILCFRLDRDYHDEARYKLFLRAIEDFCHAPLFGRGIGYTGNDDIYPLLSVGADAARWRVHWYHCLLPQIFGSLGLVGILTYTYQLVVRLRLFWRAKHTPFLSALFLAYLCSLGYSMLDPGIFSPMPFAILTVLVITLLEVQPAGEREPRGRERAEQRGGSEWQPGGLSEPERDRAFSS